MALRNALDGLATEGTLEEAVIALDQLTGALNLAKDPATGRLRVVQDGAAGTAQAVTISSGTVTTAADLTRLNNMGTNAGPLPSVAAQAVAFAQMMGPIQSLRAGIMVS